MELTQITANTITRKEDLYQQLKEVRTRGFSTNFEETLEGSMSVAAPVRNSVGTVIAAVNIIVPTIRASKNKLENFFARKVIEAANKISTAMGFGI